MTDSEKIARWAGPHDGFGQPLPDYSTDAEAAGLLNTLVSRGYDVCLLNRHDGWYVEYAKSYIDSVGPYPTIHQAITAAVLWVFEKETSDDIFSMPVEEAVTKPIPDNKRRAGFAIPK